MPWKGGAGHLDIVVFRKHGRAPSNKQTCIFDATAGIYSNFWASKPRMRTLSVSRLCSLKPPRIHKSRFDTRVQVAPGPRLLPPLLGGCGSVRNRYSVKRGSTQPQPPFPQLRYRYIRIASPPPTPGWFLTSGLLHPNFLYDPDSSSPEEQTLVAASVNVSLRFVPNPQRPAPTTALPPHPNSQPSHPRSFTALLAS